MRRVVFAVALAAAAFGCHRDPPPQPRDREAVAEPLDALSRRLGRARGRLRERGYEETGWSLRLFLPADTSRAETVRIRRGVCTTFLALSGGSVQELELALFDADGRRAAVDSVRGEGSLVHACPALEGRNSVGDALYYLKVHAMGGAGAVAIRAFESPVGSAAGVDGVFDGILAPPHRGDGVSGRLARSLDRLRSRGMSPIGETLVSRVLEGEALRRAAQLEAERCYVAVARGEDTVRDVALYLLDPTGAEVGRDLEGRDEPRIEHCPEQGGTYVIEARAAEGGGEIGILLLHDPSASPGVDEIAAAPVALDSAARGAGPDVVTTLVERGYGAPRYLVSGAALRPGEAVAHEVLLPAGCSVLLAVPDSSDVDLDLYLATREGDVISSDTRITAEARLATCREGAQPMRATVKAYGREGTYAVVLVEAPEGATDVHHVRLLEAVAPFVSRGYERATVEELELSEGEERRFYFDVPAATCFLAAAAGGETLADMDVTLRSADDGRILASDTGPAAWASVSRCAEAAERLEVRVVAYRGAGAALLQSMRRPR